MMLNPVTNPRLLRPTWMEVDLDSLAHNVGEVRRVIGHDCKLIAVAKGDAYGHGLLGVVPTMVDSGADVIALGDLNDAVRLREDGCHAPLLLFGTYLPADVAETVVEYGIMPTLWDVDGARTFSKAACGPLKVYLKVDTGLHRLGVLADEAAEAAREIENLPNLHIDCVYTHFADPIKDEFTREQYRRFIRVIEAIRAAGVAAPYACVASSAVVSMRPEMYLNAVDPGRLLYGFYHPPAPPMPLDLVPVARTVKSRIIQTKWVEAGQRIGGYNQTLYASHRTLVGVLPFGKYDGLLKSNVSRASVLVRGRRCPIIGIHLEHSLIDLTKAEGAEVGDEAVLFGEQGKAVITVSEHAEWAGVSETEAVIYLGRTIRRVYLKGGRIVALDKRDGSSIW